MKKEMLILVLTGMMVSQVIAANAVIPTDLTPGTTIQIKDLNTVQRVDVQVIGKSTLLDEKAKIQENIDFHTAQLDFWNKKLIELNALLGQMK